MKKINYPTVLTIAGTDPSGGAGIQADIKTISATGSYATSVITALVAQNTQGVQAIEAVSANFITEQLNSVFSDININAVKIGMLHNKKVISAVASALEKYKPKIIVLDPVMIAKNGSELLSLEDINFLIEKLFPLVTLITPNLFEAEKIIGHKIRNFQEMEVAAKKIAELYFVNVLLKGGHLNTSQSSDVLYLKNQSSFHWFHASRIKTKNTHGTGCTFSSAIASFLAQNYSLIKSIQCSKHYLTQAIKSGSKFKIGQGCGPVDHFYFLTGDKENAVFENA